MDGIHAVLRIAHLPIDVPLENGNVSVRLDPEPIIRLRTGDMETAVLICLRRLRAADFAL